MKVMIVSSDQELQEQLAAWIPITQDDQLVEASGMLSAIWYAETQHPDLIILDMLPPDYCGLQLAEWLKRTCPNARLLANCQGHHLESLNDKDAELADFPLAQHLSRPLPVYA